MTTDNPALAARLRALPPDEPPPGGWEALRTRLDPVRPPRRRAARLAPWALAASVLVALGLAWQPPAAPPAEAAGEEELARLMAESQSLESQLAALRPEVPVWDGQLAAAAEDLESDLAVVDLQLNVADDAAQRPLWRNRVALMSQLVQTHRAAALQPARPATTPEILL
ncbi:MAG TPA: hypothetical protein VFV11_08080 [Solimonas sp.]|nr:hypothetical protein [Solimonas sp.]